MTGPLPELLARARTTGAGAAVAAHEVALLQAELGRPVPAVLALAWTWFGAGRLGPLRLWGPADVARAIPTSERWIDEGLLPVADAAGDPCLVELHGGDDPAASLASLLPPRRVALGPLSAVLAVAAAEALRAGGDPSAAERAAAVDPDGRLRAALGGDGPHHARA